MSLYEQYQQQLRKIADVGYSIAVLNWDQETYLPEKGAGIRAQQIATLSGIAHELSVAPSLVNLIKRLAKVGKLDAKQRRNIAESQKSVEKQQKFSTDFVMRLSKTTSEAFQAWQQAKTANDFALFEPALSRMVDIQREKAALLSHTQTQHPYDALADEFEAGMTVAQLDVLFADVREQLTPFVAHIFAQTAPNDQFLRQPYDRQKQWDYGLQTLQQMGYDFKAGRQDISSHPFTTSFSPLDVRVTTRINDNSFDEMLWSCIHEGGHALYEQGLSPDDYGLPTGEATSLGIHESQSRLWENNVGRSLPYWTAHYPALQALFPEQLGGVSLRDFYRAINRVQPSLIRTNADELTYHFHILIRYEIEKGLIEGSIAVKDLPDIWNSRYKTYLQIDVPSDSKGVLQDIHWSHGGFGYFPTYSLGSFYAAQFFAQAQRDLPQLISDIAAGNTQALLSWLREKIHRHGKMYNSEELCCAITGEPLNFAYFMAYARQKYSDIYG